jgi:hypothetical protein
MSSSQKQIASQVTPQQAQLLTSRPWWTPLHTQLNAKINLTYPNTHIVATPNDQPFIYILLHKPLQFTQPTSNQLKLHKMAQSQCHDNVSELLTLKVITESQTGYALSKDGLWRCHSWGRNDKNQIVETTEARLVYAYVQPPK